MKGCEKCGHFIGYHAADYEGSCTCDGCTCDGYYVNGVDLYAEDKIEKREGEE